MTSTRFRDWPLTVILLIGITAVAFYIRVALPYDTVFDGQWIKLTGIDAYFYMRLVDNLMRNFPHLISFDPYFIYPGGGYPGDIRFWAFMLAGIIRLLGGAAPSQQVIDTIAVYVPPVMGTLVIIPVYFIGRALVNRWAGLIAAATAAVLPGELLNRSLLGFTDHHVTEEFFTSFFAMFFILALKNSRQFTYGLFKQGQFPQASRHIPYSFIAGIFMGLYLISWRGSLIFLFIIFIFFIIQFISDHLRGLPTDYLSKTAITCFLIALLIYVPVSRYKPALLALAAVILLPIILNIISVVMTARGVKPLYYPVVIVVLLGMGALGAWLLVPDFLQTATVEFNNVFSWKFTQALEGESKSLFLPGGTFALDTAWSQFALALYLGLAGLAALIYSAVRRGAPAHVFTGIWFIVIMFAAFGMVRFSPYLSVCLAVTTGYLAGYIIHVVYPRIEPMATEKPRKKGKKAPPVRRINTGRLASGIAVALVIFVMLVPGAAIAVNQAKNPAHAPSDAWMEALDWLRVNSPEPFGNPDYYYAFYDDPSTGKAFEYPATFYSVIDWCDYGYWLTRIGRRVPQSNPGQFKEYSATFFTSQDAASSSAMVDSWRSRYIIIDNRIADPNDKFYALADLSGKKESDYYELCWQQKEGKYVPLLVFYPEYYRSMVVRLYNFDGKQVSPASTMVMSWQDRKTSQGDEFKEITGLKSFRSVSEAESYIAGQKQGSYRIIGVDPLVSAVPLQELKQYKIVYQSKQKASAGSSALLPAIKIFEYTK